MFSSNNVDSLLNQFDVNLVDVHVDDNAKYGEVEYDNNNDNSIFEMVFEDFIYKKNDDDFLNEYVYQNMIKKALGNVKSFVECDMKG